MTPRQPALPPDKELDEVEKVLEESLNEPSPTPDPAHRKDGEKTGSARAGDSDEDREELYLRGPTAFSA